MSARARAVIWVLWGLWSALLWIAYANVPPCPDHATFDYIGWIAADGGRLYVDVTEQNWPGAMWLHTVSTLLFGNHLWSFRALDYAILLMASASLFGLLRGASRPLAPWLVVPLYQAMYVTSNPWFAGQRDIVGAHVLVVAAYCYRKRILHGARGWVIPLGLATAFVASMRPTYVLFPVLVFAVDVVLSRRHQRSLGLVVSDMALAALVTLLGLGAVVAWGAHTGGLEGWYQSGVLFNTQIYSQSMTVADASLSILRLPQWGWHWYLLFASVGLVTWWRRGERLVFLLVMSLFALGLVSFYVQLKGFNYHLGAWLPVLAVFIAELMAASVETARHSGKVRHFAWAVVIGLVVVAGLGKKLHHTLGSQLAYAVGLIDQATLYAHASVEIEGMTAGDMQRASEFAKRHATPDETVLTWGRAIEINFLAQRRLPVPFATIGTLEAVRPPFALADTWLSDFESILRERPPRVVFLPGKTAGPEYVRWNRSDPPRAVTALHRAIDDSYRKVAAFGSVDAYVLTALPR